MRVALALLVVALAGVSVAGAVAQEAATPPPAPDLESLKGVNFVSSCGFSHRLMDDPIVFPKQPGASHDHSFVGNVSTNAYSTLKSLRAAATTCHRPDDTAAYWTPTLLVGGDPVAPRRATIYYRRGTLAAVTAFPAGYRVIAGDAKATEPQRKRVTFWNCGANGGVPAQSDVPTCPDAKANALRLHVKFPNCWDGARLDSPDHQSHAAYSVKGVCPSTHPVALPAVTLIYVYPVAGGPDVSLVSGGQYSGHADFVNAWQQVELKRLVRVCLNALRHCGRQD